MNVGSGGASFDGKIFWEAKRDIEWVDERSIVAAPFRLAGRGL